jgi:radical SAM protein with 4Fe4S-binding SPASM domain
MKITHQEIPNIVRLELTNICNMSCPHCRHHSPKLRKENYADYYKTPIHMTEDQVTTIIDEVAASKPSFTLNVANEPLIAPAFKYAAKKVKEYGLTGTFNTNGVKIDEDIAQLLVDIEFDSVNISVDALTPETLKKARGTTKLDRLIEKVELLLKIRGEKQFPRIGVTFVITDYNNHELQGFLDFWKKRVDVIRVTGYIREGKPDITAIPGARKEDLPERVPCKQLFRDIVIRANGDVTPCVITSEYPDIVIKNIFKDGGVKAVWDSDEFNKLRELHRNFQWNEIPHCRECDYWIETFEMKEKEQDGFLIRSPSPFSVFYNVKDKLKNWNRDLVDRQGTDI